MCTTTSCSFSDLTWLTNKLPLTNWLKLKMKGRILNKDFRKKKRLVQLPMADFWEAPAPYFFRSRIRKLCPFQNISYLALEMTKWVYWELSNLKRFFEIFSGQGRDVLKRTKVPDSTPQGLSCKHGLKKLVFNVMIVHFYFDIIRC